MNVVLAFLEEHRGRLDLDRYGIDGPLSSLVLTPRFQASRHVVFLLFRHGGREPRLVAKIPRLIDANASLAREAGSLSAVQSLRPAGFDSVPRLVAFEPYRGRPLLIESALAGPLMAPDLVRRDPGRCISVTLDWLLDVHAASARPGGAGWFQTLVEQPLRQFAATFPLADDEQRLIDQPLAIVEPLRKAQLPFVCEHGDLSHPNLILTTPDTLGVVDWELATMDGLPGYDLFVFLTYVAFSREKAAAAPSHLAAFRQAFFSPGAWAPAVAVTYAGQAQIPLSQLSALFVLCWARYTTTLFARLAGSDGTPAGTMPEQTAAWLRTNRYYQLWRESVSEVRRLEWPV